MKYLHRLFFALFIFSLAITPSVSFAQEEVTTTTEAGTTEIAIGSFEENVAKEVDQTTLVISNVSIEKERGGVYRISWMTNEVSAGAVTYVNNSEYGAIQHRLTNGLFSKQHQYLVEGLSGGVNTILLESVGSDLSYVRKAIEVTAQTKEQTQEPASSTGLMIVFFFLTPLILLIIAEELFRLRREMKTRLNDLSKSLTKKKAVRRKSAASKKKAAAKKSDKK